LLTSWIRAFKERFKFRRGTHRGRTASLDTPRKWDFTDARSEARQLGIVVDQLLKRHHNFLALPPDFLRLHVGTQATTANFLAQGANSSGRVLRTFGKSPQRPVLDWGCGSGRTLRWLWEYPAWREQYRGCDVDRDAIEWLRQQGMASVEVCNPTPPLPYPDDAFAGLFAFSVLTHIHPQEHAAWYHEIARVLRPGGLAYLTTQGRSLADRLPPDARKQLEAHGFTYVEHEGHCKDAAIASEEFTRAVLAGVPELELGEYTPRGYQNMDAFTVVRVATDDPRAG
jgi:SAM-dependent methyltransferase